MFRLRLKDSRGSTPLELVIWMVLLLAPLAPLLGLYAQLSDQLAAESIARHGLRSAVLNSNSHQQLVSEIPTVLRPLELSWGKKVTRHELSCQTCLKGDILTLRVWVGNAVGVQSAALGPK